MSTVYDVPAPGGERLDKQDEAEDQPVLYSPGSGWRVVRAIMQVGAFSSGRISCAALALMSACGRTSLPSNEGAPRPVDVGGSTTPSDAGHDDPEAPLEPSAGGTRSVSSSSGAVGSAAAPNAGDLPADLPPADLVVPSLSFAWHVWDHPAIRLVATEEGEAAALYETADGGWVQRYRQGQWEPARRVPEEGFCFTAALSTLGTLECAWKGWSELTEPNTDDILASTLDAADVWTTPVRVGASAIGSHVPTWTVPVIGADGAAGSIVVWSRLDQSETDPLGTSSMYASHRSQDGTWSTPTSIDLPDTIGANVPSLSVRTDGSALAAWIGATDAGSRVLLARFSEGQWSEPAVVEAEATYSQPSVVYTAQGDAVVFCRSSSNGQGQLTAHFGSDPSNWDASDAVATLSTDSSQPSVFVTSTGKAMGTWSPTPADDACEHAVTGAWYTPGAGWSDPEDLGPGDAYRIAQHPSGAAAMAYLGSFAQNASPSTECKRQGLYVRRYQPGEGWTETEVIDESADHVTGLAFAGDDLLLAWTRPEAIGFVRTLR